MSARVLLAHHDAERVLVFQAHGAAVADAALARGAFGGPDWSLRRTSRLRPSLASLLARCDWGRRVGRERILGLHLRRPVFDGLVRQAVPADFEEGGAYATRAAWRLATRFAQVVVSWHDDVDLQGVPTGVPTLRMGVREQAMALLSVPENLQVEDWTERVVAAREGRASLELPALRPYPLDPAIARQLTGEA